MFVLYPKKGDPMKYAVIAFLFSVSAFASEISFKCNFSDVTYVNQFSIEAKNVQVEDGKFVNTEFDFSLRKAGRDQQVERFVVTRDGTAQVFEAGTMYNKRTARLASAVKGDELEYINILVDVPPQYSSQIRFLNGMTYLGSCKSL